MRGLDDDRPAEFNGLLTRLLHRGGHALHGAGQAEVAQQGLCHRLVATQTMAEHALVGGSHFEEDA